MTLLKDYLNQWATFEDERLYLLKKLDSSIMKAMLKNNIPLDEVKKSIRDNSSLCQGKSFIAIKKYIDSFEHDIQPSETKPTTRDYNDYKQKYMPRIFDFYVQKETKIMQILQQKGYKLTDIKDIIVENTPLLKDIDINLSEKLTYFSKLNINYTKKITDINKAKEIYMIELNNLKLRHTNFKLNLYYDAKIAFSMYYEKNYDLSTIEELLAKYTQNSHAKQPEYTNAIINFVKEHTHLYHQLTNTNIIKPQNTKEKYIKYLNEYLKNTLTKSLTPLGEKQIIKRLLSEGADNTEVLNVIKAFSPVVREIGRKKNYADTIVNLASEDILKAKEHLTKVENIFKEKIKQLPQNPDNLAYALLAKEMILAGCYPEYVVKIFNEKIYSSKDKTAYYIVKSAQNNIKAEREITEFICPDNLSNMTLEQINNKHISLKDVYKYAIKERILSYPNTKLNLSDEYIDIDASIKLLNRYPGINKNELAHIIRETSARMQLPEIPQDYPKLVIEKAAKKLAEVFHYNKTQEEQKKELKEDYQLEVAINDATINNTDNDEEYIKCDYRAALSFIKKGIEENDIKNIIAEEQSTRNNKDALENFKYAEYITSIAKKINTRQLNIINVLDTKNNRPTVENMYKTHMKELYQKTNLFNQDMEINAAMYMLYKDIKKEDIALTLTKYSPHAVEPNHSSLSYINKAIIYNAQQKLTVELEKRREFAKKTLVDKDINNLYSKYYSDYKENIDLPFDMIADTIIAANIIKAGFKLKDTLDAIASQSPNLTNISNENISKYGQQIEIILNKLTNTLNDTKVQKHNLAHTLTLTNEQEAN